MHGPPYDIWFIRGYSDAGVLCTGSSQQMVRAGVCRGVRARVGVWVSSRSLAVWTGGSRLVHGGCAAMEAVCAEKLIYRGKEEYGLHHCRHRCGPAVRVPDLRTPQAGALLRSL